MAPGWWNKVKKGFKNAWQKTKQFFGKAGKFVKDTALPAIGQGLQKVGQIAPQVIDTVGKIAPGGKLQQFAERAGQGLQTAQQMYDKYSPTVGKVAGAMAGLGG